MVMNPLSVFLSNIHTSTHVLAAASRVSGIEVVSFWLEFGTTVSLIRVERDHMADWLA